MADAPSHIGVYPYELIEGPKFGTEVVMTMEADEAGSLEPSQVDDVTAVHEVPQKWVLGMEPTELLRRLPDELCLDLDQARAGHHPDAGLVFPEDGVMVDAIHSDDLTVVAHHGTTLGPLQDPTEE
jgi:hypothetical protein